MKLIWSETKINTAATKKIVEMIIDKQIHSIIFSQYILIQIWFDHWPHLTIMRRWCHLQRFFLYRTHSHRPNLIPKVTIIQQRTLPNLYACLCPPHGNSHLSSKTFTFEFCKCKILSTNATIFLARNDLVLLSIDKFGF